MDLSKGTLPLAPAFPILVANSIDWLAPSPDQRSQAGIPPAESDLRSPTVTAPLVAAAPTLHAPASDVTTLWLIAALILTSAEWWYNRRRSHARRPRGLADLSRAGVVVMLALGVAGLKLPGGIAPIAGFVVLDRSASMGSGVRGLEQVATLAGGRHDEDRFGVIVFGAAPAVERRLGTDVALPAITSTVEAGGTNIEAALRTARTALPPEGPRRIVLVSDGQQTAGDALREARRAAREGVRIDVVLPVWVSAGARAMDVTRVTAPPWVRVGEPFELTAVVEGKPGARGDLVLHREGASSTAVPVTIPRSGMTTVGFTDRQPAAGMYTYRVQVSLPTDDLRVDGDDTTAGTGVVVGVSGEPLVLHVGGAPTGVDGVLARAGFRVDAVAPGSLPATAAALASYDAIVLDDVAGDQLSEAQGAAMVSYVEQSGGGLLILGSARSLDAGFGGSTALTALSPIDFRPRGGQRAPGASLVIVFDKSGSMADLVDGAPKIEYARQAVERVLEVVSDADLVGVIAFDSTALPVVPLAAGHSAASVKARLRATEAAGATAIGPAMELARSWLRSAPASVTARRHILVVSDGRTSPADAARALDVAAEPGIQVSAVALDGGSDRELLAAMASRSGGRAYFPSDTRDLPRLLAREASRVAGGRVVDEPFKVRIAPHAVTTGLDDASGPTLRGYVVGAVKPQAEAALVSHLGDPILATARRGLGRVGVYTADLRSPWSADLRSWRGFPTLMAQTARWITRRATADGLFTSIQSTDSGLHIVVETDNATHREARVLVRRPASNIVETVALEPTLPGRFEGRVEAAVAGPYLLSMTAGADSSEAALVRGYFWTPERELASSGMDLQLLSAIARTTRGRVLDEGVTMFSGPRDRVWRPGAVWLASVALAAFLAELLAPACGGLIQRLRRRPRPFLASVDTA
jgi:Mg-chelatase subunit ChlD